MTDTNPAATPGSQGSPNPSPNPTPPNPAPAATPPAGSPTAAAPAAFKVPDAYKEKSWASKVKSEDDVYKQLDNLDSLVGKKTYMPDFEKAQPKEIEDYYNAIRPKDKTGYQFDETVAPELKDGFGEILHKNGISAYQANNLIKDYNALESAVKAKMYDHDALLADVAKTKGEGAKQNIVQARDALKKVAPPELMARIDKMPNEAYGAMFEVTHLMINRIKQIQKEYGAKEGVDVFTNTQPSATGQVDYKTEIANTRKELNALAVRNHSAADKKVLVDKLSDLIIKSKGNK